MWENILFIFIGAALSMVSSWITRRDERKKFELERKDKYKMVAIEKRLEAHQKAMYYWYKLLNILYDKDKVKRDDLIHKATEFLYNNALYLEKETRENFPMFIVSVKFYPDVLEAFQRVFDEGFSPQRQVTLQCAYCICDQ